MPSDEYDFANVSAKSELRRTAENEQYSGHVLFCPKCRDFRRCRMSLLAENGTPLLKVECRICGSADYFLVRPNGSTIHAQMAGLVHRYAGRRAIQFLADAHEKEVEDARIG